MRPASLHIRSTPLRLIVTVMMVIAIGATASTAMAATAAPHWTVSAFAAPTNFVPNTERKSVYHVTAHNDGGAATDGVSTIVLTDTLPPEHVTATKVTGLSSFGGNQETGVKIPCAIEAGVPTCKWNQATLGAVPSGTSLTMEVTLNVDGSASGSLIDGAAVGGGGAAGASTSISTPVSLAEAPFGFDTFTFGATDPEGLASTQAGGHPYALRTDLNTSTILNKELGGLSIGPEDEARDFVTDLPLGLLGDPQAVTQCPES